MKIHLSFWPNLVSYLLILLFTYAAVSKLLDFENFQVQLAQSPVLSAYAGAVSYGIILIELIAVLILTIRTTRIYGLYLSLCLMTGFTIYIYLILNYSDFVPCSCGGILEKLGWTEHLIFNLVFVFITLTAIYTIDKLRGIVFIKTSIVATAAILFSSGLIVGLFLSSEYIIKEANNFTRRFLLHPIIDYGTIDLGLNSYYFAGAANGRIYLGNYTAPLNMLEVDTALQSTKKVRLALDQAKYQFRNLQLRVKAPYFYLYDGSVPIIYRGTIGTPEAHTISYKQIFFNVLTVVDTNRFALRTQNSSNRLYTLGILFIDGKGQPRVSLKPDILQRQVDGVFDVTGRLVADSHGNSAYVYTYRNQFIVLDSNLNVRKRLNTIDTNSIAKISTVKLSDGRHKMNAPPFKVNGISTINRTLLFNQSMLPGHNESKAQWSSASVIDVYRTDRKAYVGSFYLYDQKKEKISDMLAKDEYLYVLFGNTLQQYRFRKNITDLFKGEAENLKE